MTAADRARASRAAQGLTPTVEDPGVLARVAGLLARNGSEAPAATREPREIARHSSTVTQGGRRAA